MGAGGAVGTTLEFVGEDFATNDAYVVTFVIAANQNPHDATNGEWENTVVDGGDSIDGCDAAVVVGCHGQVNFHGG